MLAVAGDLKPSIGRTRRLIRRWSCSMRLFKYCFGGFGSAPVAGGDRLPVGLAAVDDDAIGSAMPVARLPEEPLGRRKRALGTRRPMIAPGRTNERWSLDFVSDAFTDGRRFRVLAVAVDCRRTPGCEPQCRTTSLTAHSRPQHQTRSGSRTSPTSGPPKDGLRGDKQGETQRQSG